MFCSRTPRTFSCLCLALVSALFLASCARQPAAPTENLAILRFENLSQSGSADWIGRAIPVILESELRDAPHIKMVGTPALHALDGVMGTRPISAPGVSAERPQAFAAGASQLAYGEYAVRGGKLHVRLWLEDTRTQKIAKVAEVSVLEDDAIGAATGLAWQIATRVVAYPTRSEACIRAYAEGLESKDLGQAAARMEEAIAADADFGPAYRSLFELDIQRQDREAALAVLNRALGRPEITPLDRARLQLDLATLRNDAAGKEQAFATLAKLEPGNARTWQSLGDAAMNRHDFEAAVASYRRALEIEPGNVTLLNQFAYAATFAGHFEEGEAALHKYRGLRPNDANALDSMGDLNLLVNRFHEAEAFYLQAHKLDPNFKANCDLFKAAMARAMAGDLPGADELYSQYIVARTLGHDSDAPFKRAEWFWLTGRRKAALSEVLASARTAEARQDRTAAARAYAESSIWNLMADHRAAAQELALKAAALADASSASAVLIARFMSQPSAAAGEWEARAGRFLPNPAQSAVKDQVLAWALLLDRQFAAARIPLQRIYDSTGTASNEGILTLLAWCDVETGRLDLAASSLALMPVPPLTGVSAFMPLWFPRIFELRAVVAEKAGKAEEARRDRELFAKLAGQ